MDDDGDDEIMDLIERFDRYFECSIATLELSSSPWTDSRRGTEDNHILVLHVRAGLPAQDKVLQTDLQ